MHCYHHELYLVHTEMVLEESSEGGRRKSVEGTNSTNVRMMYFCETFCFILEMGFSVN